MRASSILLAIATPLFGTADISASAQTIEDILSADTPLAEVEVLPGWRQQTPDGPRHFFGLSVTLAAGWKTYWRNPGETGLPPMLLWTQLDNVQQPILHYPSPRLFEDAASQIPILGYENSVVFPIEVPVDSLATTAGVSGSLEFGICREVCIPSSFEFQVELPPDHTVSIDAIVAAINDKPRLVAASQTDVQFTCRFVPNQDSSLQVSVLLDTGSPIPENYLVLFEYPDPLSGFHKTDTLSKFPTSILANTEMYFWEKRPPPIDRSLVNLILATSENTTIYTGCTAPR